jgi:hypothetical protein
LTNSTDRDTIYTSNNEPLGDKMPLVFQLFDDLKEARSFCRNHSMKGIDKLVIARCLIHKSPVFYVMDSTKHLELQSQNFKIETLYIYE